VSFHVGDRLLISGLIGILAFGFFRIDFALLVIVARLEGDNRRISGMFHRSVGVAETRVFLFGHAVFAQGGEQFADRRGFRHVVAERKRSRRELGSLFAVANPFGCADIRAVASPL
jgi:hypothetical protein